VHFSEFSPLLVEHHLKWKTSQFNCQFQENGNEVVKNCRYCIPALSCKAARITMADLRYISANFIRGLFGTLLPTFEVFASFIGLLDEGSNTVLSWHSVFRGYEHS